MPGPDIKNMGPSFVGDLLRKGAPDYTVGAQVVNADVVAVRNSAAADSHNATAVVSGSTLTGVNFAATVAMVDNADSVPLGDATAVANGQDNGTAAVAAGVITRITLPSTDKIMKSTVVYTCPQPTGTWVSSIRFTIVNGAITAVVLS